jgi:ribonuclease T2
MQRLFLDEMPGPQKILKSVVNSLGLLDLGDPLGLGLFPSEGKLSTCPRSELSCKTKFDSQDTCCFNYPGGHFLQTQFWDADPAVGPDDSWTIHGLW